MMNLLTSREEQIFETNHSDNGDELAVDRAFQSSLDGEPMLFDSYVTTAAHYSFDRSSV